VVDVSAFTVFVVLPHDLQLHDEALFGYNDGEPWDGWTREAMGALIGLDGPVDKGTTPACRLIFRRAHGRLRMPPARADREFDDLVLPTLSLGRRVSRRIGSAAAGLVSRRTTRTAAAISLYAIDRDGSYLSDEAAQTRAKEALDALNDFLAALSMGGGDALVGPLAAGDLPVAVPYVSEVVPGYEKLCRRSDGMAGLHVWAPELLDIPRPMTDVEQAAAMFRAWREGREPAFPVLELSHTAVRDLLAGRRGMAAITAGTAIDVLIGLVLRRAWLAAGLRSGDLQPALDAKPREQLQTHVARILQQRIDLRDVNSPPGRWWRDGYLLRNRVVHEGYRPTFAEVEASVNAARDLIVFVGAGLDQRSATRGVAGGLPTARMPSARYAGLRNEN
jgi:hypothetical protein